MSGERIQITSNGASDSETAAIVAAVEQFLADTAPPAARRGARRRPMGASGALEEGIAARQLHGDAWGHAPRPR